MRALNGYHIIEIREGEKIRHFPSRSTVNQYSTAKCRVMDLLRDRRFKHLGERHFEIWDGISAVMKITAFPDGTYVEKSYLLKPKNMIEAQGYERDWNNYYRPRLKNQRTGKSSADISSWVMSSAKDPGKFDSSISRVKASKESERTYTRWSGRLSDVGLGHQKIKHREDDE